MHRKEEIIMYSYAIAKMVSKLSRNKREFMSRYFRRCGIECGKNCNILSDIMTKEPFLIHIGNNVTISSGVRFATHDASVAKVFGPEIGSDIFGEINIGNDCFIGLGAIILPGVTLADRIIVASGSVVTKSFSESDVIIGGNPARVIGNWTDFKEKTKPNLFAVKWMKSSELKKIIFANKEKLIKK